MSNNPMVDIQLNKHEDEIAKAKNDIYLQGLGLKWCEEHITALEKKNNTELPPEVSSLIAQNSHTEQLYKGMVREADEYRNRFRETNEKLEAALRVIDSKEETLDMALKNVYKLSKENENLQKLVNDLTEGKKALEESRNEWKNNTHKANCDKLTLMKENDRLKKEANWYHTQYAEKSIELHRLKSETDDIEAYKEQLNADFGILAENHKALGENYADLKLRYENMAFQADKLRMEMKVFKDELKDKETSIKMLKADLEEKTKEYVGAKTEILTLKTRYANKTIEFNKLKKEHLDLKREHDNLTKAADKYSWKRVNISEILPLEDHGLYLFAVDGYPTPVKGRYHDDPLRNITILVDDGKGPEQKVLFFMDGHIRFWTSLPEMPEGVDS